MEDKIVIIGANDFQNQLILKAKSMGYETHVFAWEDGAVGKETADFFYPISITEKEAILEECKKIRPKGITSIASDLAVHTVNFIANELHLIGNSMLSTAITTNKYLMRQRFQEKQIKTPEFASVSSVDDCNQINFNFPLIVKPTDRSGSRGVTKVTNKEELLNAVQDCISVSFEKKAIVEEFIQGEEFSAEFISYQGTHKMLAVTKKYTTGVPHFIETGHMEPAQLSNDVFRKIETELSKAHDALEIMNGASHPEFKIDDNGDIRIIEIGARMGGDCIGSDLVPLSSGYDFMRMVIQVACGDLPDFSKNPVRKNAFIRFIFTQSDLELLKEIKNKYPELIYRISDIDPINTHAVVDSSTRFGYYILTCDSAQQGIHLLNLN